MKLRLLTILCCMSFTLMASAQASGEQITRKSRKISHSVTNKSNKKKDIISSPSGYHNGIPYVDLGLSVKWGYYNVGASTPESSGYFFAWGETESKSTYNWSNYFDSKKIDYRGIDQKYTFHIYNYSDGLKTITPESGRDAARKTNGGSWRMPSHKEFEELKEKCSWTKSNYNGVDGYIVKANNGKCIFLPIYFSYEMTTWGEVRKGETYYWSNEMYPNFSSRAYCMFIPDFLSVTLSGRLRCDGQLIRPVF